MSTPAGQRMLPPTSPLTSNLRELIETLLQTLELELSGLNRAGNSTLKEAAIYYGQRTVAALQDTLRAQHGRTLQTIRGFYTWNLRIFHTKLADLYGLSNFTANVTDAERTTHILAENRLLRKALDASLAIVHRIQSTDDPSTQRSLTAKQ